MTLSCHCKSRKCPRQKKPWGWVVVLLSVTSMPALTCNYQPQPHITAVPQVLSFEDPSELDYFTFPRSSRVSTSIRHYKDGFHSMLWQWGSGDELSVRLGRRLSSRNAGIKFWIYRNVSSVANVSVCLMDSALPSGERTVIQFHFSLRFTGWRAVWVALREAESLPREVGYDQVQFIAPSDNISSQIIFIDLVCFLRHISFQSRDQIVTPISGSIYTIREVWQQTYRWSLEHPPQVNATTPLSADERRQLNELYLIEKRLVNWFARESVAPVDFKGIVLKRWQWFTRYLLQARGYMKELNVTVSGDGVITGSPLFVKRSQFGQPLDKKGRNKKLGDVAFQVLFPLTLEYYFATNRHIIGRILAKELANVNTFSRRHLAVRRIANDDLEYSEFLLTELRRIKTPVTLIDLRRCLRRLNQKKLDTILLLLEYIADQGWTEGSAMGSLDHAMNKVGSGFVNSVFLLRNELAERGKLVKLLRTMRWYNDFGEIYQRNFEYSGTTADRLRTIMIYRLQVILMSPQGTVLEARAKLRDMAAYVRWCNNALLRHPSFMSTFKPDLSCFHHLSIYGTAYSPEALIKSSMLLYLLDGTSFSLNARSRQTIRERLFAYERLAPKYSLPNSITGRFPRYSGMILVRMLPAYVFFSVRPQNLTHSGHLQEVSLGNDTNMIRAFLRLYPSNPATLELLWKTMYMKVDYTASIGSLQLLQAVRWKAKESHAYPAAPQTGHWVQNFAAFSIHRRRHWVVTVKGFSRYFWDFENSSTENIYGMYQSHGALQISNSEESLKAYDVMHGWDWTRVPGTTTIKLNLEQMAQATMRNYQQSKLVGGVLLTSNDSSLSNGLFAMRFQQPRYNYDGWKSCIYSKCGKATKKAEPKDSEDERSQFENFYFPQNAEFHFKKSVFFFDSLMVCLGSDISAKNYKKNRAQTTLFQDKYITKISAIYVDGKLKWLSDDFSQVLNTSASATLLDTNGNGYYIPKGSSANVAISRQTSMTDDGLTVTQARYAVVWLDHGLNPSSASYEYAILVGADVHTIEALRKAQASDSPRYEVLAKNSAAHVVRFESSTARPSITYGYAFFNDGVYLDEGPVEGVSAECIVMAEIDAANYSNINLSISSPDMNYNTTKVLNQSDDAGVNECFYMISQAVNISVYLTKPVFLQRVLVNGKAVDKSQYDHYVAVRKLDHSKPAGREIVFKNLVNGESVEAYLTLVRINVEV